MKLMSFLILSAIVVSPMAFAEDMAKSMPMGEMGKEGMMKMRQFFISKVLYPD